MERSLKETEKERDNKVKALDPQSLQLEHSVCTLGRELICLASILHANPNSSVCVVCKSMPCI